MRHGFCNGSRFEKASDISQTSTTYPGSMKATGTATAQAADDDRAHTPQRCGGALNRAFRFLGKRWNGMILATLDDGPHGFAELRRAVGGISDSVLSDRLAELAEAGLVLRQVDPGPPITAEYRLSPSGQALMPVLGSLASWASVHLAGTDEDGACGDKPC